ncbi:MAG: PP0621 family protein [Noviherbaspirillum sp.]
MKYLLLAAVVAIVVFWVLRPAKRRLDPASGTQHPGPKPAQSAEAMLSCAHCGTYIPASEAVVVAGAVYCCEEHHARHGRR